MDVCLNLIAIHQFSSNISKKNFSHFVIFFYMTYSFVFGDEQMFLIFLWCHCFPHNVCQIHFFPQRSNFKSFPDLIFGLSQFIFVFFLAPIQLHTFTPPRIDVSSSVCIAPNSPSQVGFLKRYLMVSVSGINHWSVYQIRVSSAVNENSILPLYRSIHLKVLMSLARISHSVSPACGWF